MPRKGKRTLRRAEVKLAKFELAQSMRAWLSSRVAAAQVRNRKAAGAREKVPGGHGVTLDMKAVPRGNVVYLHAHNHPAGKGSGNAPYVNPNRDKKPNRRLRN